MSTPTTLSAKGVACGAEGVPWGGVDKTTRFDMLVTSLLISVLALVLPLSLLQVYDRIIPNQSYSTISILVAFVGVAIALEGCMRLARSYFLARASAKFEHRIGVAAFAKMLNADIGEFERVGTGEHVERLNAVATLREFHAGQTMQTMLELAFAGLYLWLIYFLGGTLIFVPLIAIATLCCVCVLVGFSLRRALARSNEQDDRHANVLVSMLRGLFSAKAQAFESMLQRRYEAINEKRCEAGERADARAQLITDAAAVLGQASVVAVVAYGSLLVIDGSLSVGRLAACTLLVGRALQPLQGAIGLWSRFQSITLARSRVKALFAMPEAPCVTQSTPDDAPLDLDGGIEVRNVSFRFTEDSPQLLDNVSLSVRPGEMIALTGPNGSGKTTLLSLIRGLIEPSEGEVLVDGMAIRDIPRDQLSHQVAYVSAREKLFRGSIMENLTMYKTEREPRAYLVAESLGFADEIRSLPQGFNTVVADGVADTLSRGLVQRLALARALIGGPKVVLFDDANSSVDNAGDTAIKALLQRLRGHCTVILVTHRPSFMWLADRVHDLRDGYLEASGLSVEHLREAV